MGSQGLLTKWTKARDDDEMGRDRADGITSYSVAIKICVRSAITTNQPIQVELFMQKT